MTARKANLLIALQFLVLLAYIPVALYIVFELKGLTRVLATCGFFACAYLIGRFIAPPLAALLAKLLEGMGIRS